MDLSKKESSCVRAHATRQISHPRSPGKSKYTIILLQEYKNINAFDVHCEQAYVIDFFKRYVENKSSSIVESWTCRLFSEEN
jgi:quinol monooxygenase YgiN